MNEILLYDYCPDYGEYICPVMTGCYCPYGTSPELCKNCGWLKTIAQAYGEAVVGLGTSEDSYGLNLGK